MSPEVTLALVAGAAVGAFAAWLATRRRTRQEAIAHNLVPHRTRQVLATLPMAAIVVARDRRAAASNALATSLGLARPDGALQAEVADLAERAWMLEEPVDSDIHVRRGALGTPAVVHLRIAPIDDGLALALASDSTEQRAAEISRREFAINVSHELKTPVGALVLLAETLEASADEPQTVREFAGKIGTEATRLSKLIQEIIEISRLQSADTPVEREPMDVVAAVGEAVEAARVAADARQISLTFSARGKARVDGDRDLLVMAVRNLVDNAIAYSDAGRGVTVVVEPGGDHVSVSVIDQGIGIEQVEHERIFERFYRTDPARSRETGGTGLGLSIVKHVAAQHDGEVEVWSRPGVGSTFTLRLPLHGKGAAP